MFKNLLKLNALLALFVTGMMSSCSDENSTVDVDNYVIETTFEIQKAFKIGKPGCYELVFPVTLEFPDATTAEVDSYENLKETVRAWKEANTEVDGRPSLEFPVDVLSQDGELITINEKSELVELAKECISDYRDGPRDHHRLGKFRACFRLVMPLSIELPSGIIVEVQNYQQLKNVLREWKMNNPNATERPHLVYPLTIAFEDGSTQEIASPEELRQAKKDCRDYYS